MKYNGLKTPPPPDAILTLRIIKKEKKHECNKKIGPIFSWGRFRDSVKYNGSRDYFKTPIRITQAPLFVSELRFDHEAVGSTNIWMLRVIKSPSTLTSE